MSFSPRTIAELADDLPFEPHDVYEQRWLQLAWRGALLAALAFGAYGVTLTGGWLWLDDAFIANDLRLRTGTGLGQIWSDAFTNAPAGPLTMTLWWLEHQIARASPLLHRTVAVGLHAWTCIALWLVMRRLNISAAWLIAAVIAVHPAILNVVAWPSRVGAVFGMAIGATALLALLRARDVKPPIEVPDELQADALPDEFHDLRWPCWTMFWTCALSTPLADPTAAMVLAAAIPFALRAGRSQVGILIFIAVASLAVVGIATAIWTGIHPANIEIAAASTGRSDLLLRLVAAPLSATAAIVPSVIPTVADPSNWTGFRLAFSLLGGIVLIVALVTFSLNRARRDPSRRMLVGGAVAVIVASTIGHLLVGISRRDGLMTEMAIYPILIATLKLAVCLINSEFTSRLRDSSARLMSRWAIGSVLICGLGGWTLARSSAFGSQQALWAAAVARGPDSIAIRLHSAAFLVANGDPDRAAADLDGIDVARRDVRWLLARGRVYESQNRSDDAAAIYAQAYQASRDNADVIIALAEAQRRAGRPNAAILLYEQFLERHPNTASIHNNLGLAHAFAGDADRSVASYERAIEIDPNYVAARLNLANVLFELGRYEESAAQLKRATQIDPRNFAAFMNSGSMLYRLRDYKASERMFRVAAALDPDSPDAFDRLGIALAAQGTAKLQEAIWHFTRASRLRPDDAAIAERLDNAKQQAAASTQPV